MRSRRPPCANASRTASATSGRCWSGSSWRTRAMRGSGARGKSIVLLPALERRVREVQDTEGGGIVQRVPDDARNDAASFAVRQAEQQAQDQDRQQGRRSEERRV